MSIVSCCNHWGVKSQLHMLYDTRKVKLEHFENIRNCRRVFTGINLNRIRPYWPYKKDFTVSMHYALYTIKFLLLPFFQNHESRLRPITHPTHMLYYIIECHCLGNVGTPPPSPALSSSSVGSVLGCFKSSSSTSFGSKTNNKLSIVVAANPQNVLAQG